MLEEKLKTLDRQYAELEARLAAPETYDDPTRVARLNKEQRDLEPVVTAYRTYVRRQKDLADAQALMSDPDMKELAQEEYQAAKADLERLVEEIRILLLPRPQRRQERHCGDPGRGGRRGGRPLCQLPLSHVLHVRRIPPLAGGGGQRQ